MGIMGIMGINNNNTEHLGMVDSMSSNPSIKQTAQYLQNESKTPLENSFPTINPVPYHVDVMTQTVDWEHPMQRGVVANSEYSHNTSQQFEQRIQHQQEEIYRNNRSIYSMPPSSSGGPNLKEEVKPSKEKLAELQVREKVKTLSSRLRQLQTEESNTLTRLSRTREALKLIKEDLAELEG